MIVKRILTAIAGALLTGLLIFITTLLIQIRDNNKFLQPGLDEKQNQNIHELKRQINVCDSMSFERDKSQNVQIDDIKAMSEMSVKKSDSLLLYTKYNTIMIQKLIKGNRELSDLYKQLLTMK